MRPMETRKRSVEHKNIRTAVLKKIARVDNVQGLVFSGSLKRFMNYRKAVRHLAGFKIYDGDEKAFLEQPSADGVVAGGANLLPQAQQYPDHTIQILETAGMLTAFHALYSQNPAAMMKRMLHVAGVLPNAHITSATEPTTADQNGAVEEICKEYDLA